MAGAELCPSPSQQRWARDGQSFILLLPPKACLASRNRPVVQSVDLTSAKPNQCGRNGALWLGKEDPKSVLLLFSNLGTEKQIVFPQPPLLPPAPFELIIFQGFFLLILSFLYINSLKKRKKRSSSGVLDTLPTSERKGNNYAI